MQVKWRRRTCRSIASLARDMGSNCPQAKPAASYTSRSTEYRYHYGGSLPSVSDQQHTYRASKSSPDMREPIPSEQRCCGKEICRLHMSILQGACEQQCEDRENQPSGCLWARIFRTGRRCRKEKVCLPVPILQWTCEQQREDRANRPSICVQQSILRQGR